MAAGRDERLQIGIAERDQPRFPGCRRNRWGTFDVSRACRPLRWETPCLPWGTLRDSRTPNAARRQADGDQSETLARGSSITELGWKRTGRFRGRTRTFRISNVDIKPLRDAAAPAFRFLQELASPLPATNPFGEAPREAPRSRKGEDG